MMNSSIHNKRVQASDLTRRSSDDFCETYSIASFERDEIILGRRVGVGLGSLSSVYEVQDCNLRPECKKKSPFLSLSLSVGPVSHSENTDGFSNGVGTVYAPIVASNPPVPILTSDPEAEDSDRAAGPTSDSLDVSSSSRGKKMKRSVSFVSVDVREYDRTIGDNPSCRSGPPLSLDWSYSKKYEHPKALDEYELEREPERVQHIDGLLVNKYRRRNLLSFNWGHSEEEMKSARQETKKLQRQRSMTQMLLPIHIAEEAFISVKGFVAKRRGKAEAECPKQELKRITSELTLSLSQNKSTKDTSPRSEQRRKTAKKEVVEK